MLNTVTILKIMLWGILEALHCLGWLATMNTWNIWLREKNRFVNRYWL